MIFFLARQNRLHSLAEIYTSHLDSELVITISVWPDEHLLPGCLAPSA